MIEGIRLTPLNRVPTPAGDVLHGLKASGPGFFGFGEAYFSQIYEGATKAWRRHDRATLNLMVPVGLVRFVVHDDRPESSSVGVFEQYWLGETSYARLTVGPGLWMAFQGIGPGTSTILDISNQEYDPGETSARELSTFPFDWTTPAPKSVRN